MPARPSHQGCAAGHSTPSTPSASPVAEHASPGTPPLLPCPRTSTPTDA